MFTLSLSMQHSIVCVVPSRNLIFPLIPWQLQETQKKGERSRPIAERDRIYARTQADNKKYIYTIFAKFFHVVFLSLASYGSAHSPVLQQLAIAAIFVSNMLTIGSSMKLPVLHCCCYCLCSPGIALLSAVLLRVLRDHRYLLSTKIEVLAHISFAIPLQL